MKLSILSFVIAGVGLVSNVAGAPMRVVIVTSHQEMTSTHPSADNNNLVHILPYRIPNPSSSEAGPQRLRGAGRKPCGAGGRGGRLASMREKSLAMSNAFRQALGLPLIEADAHLTHEKLSNSVWAMPMKGMLHVAPASDSDEGPKAYPAHGHRFHHGHHKHDKSFLRKIHFALMSLGVWEGRAVAFVLGCGIGVLLRMFWVMSIISYRMIRGIREEEDHEYEIIHVYEHFEDAEHILVPPPQYIYNVEKVEVVEEQTPATV